jgi:hypothetical protein
MHKSARQDLSSGRKLSTALTDANIEDAVALWFSDQTSAEEMYGLLSAWNTVAVTSLIVLFCGAGDEIDVIRVACITHSAADFNGDLSLWDVSSVTNLVASKLTVPVVSLRGGREGRGVHPCAAGSTHSDMVYTHLKNCSISGSI